MAETYTSDILFGISYDLYESALEGCVSHLRITLPDPSLLFEMEGEKGSGLERRDIQMMDLVATLLPYCKNLLMHADRATMEQAKYIFSEAIAKVNVQYYFKYVRFFCSSC